MTAIPLVQAGPDGTLVPHVLPTREALESLLLDVRAILTARRAGAAWWLAMHGTVAPPADLDELARLTVLEALLVDAIELNASTTAALEAARADFATIEQGRRIYVVRPPDTTNGVEEN